jgi:ADP-ribosylglycohydrolase
MSSSGQLDIVADRFAGCLVGQALGDALGFVIEGNSPEECAAYVESAVRTRKLTGYARGLFQIGQYSDDTQLARELALSLVACDGFNPADYATRIAAMFTQHRIVGPGMSTMEAAFRLADGCPWDKAGTPAPAAGNGSAMRAAPAGLLFAHDTEKLIKTVHDQGRITHSDPRCSAGAIAIAGAVGSVVLRGELDASALCASLAERTRPFDETMAAALEQLVHWREESPGIAVTRIAGIAGYSESWEGISPFVTPSVLWSLYSVFHSPDDYWEAICTAIAVGGDVDTTAAMAGAIAGATVGLKGIPTEPCRLLSDQGAWGYEALVQLASDLYDLHRRLRDEGSARLFSAT